MDKDRMEILRMAVAAAGDNRDPLDLAREMMDFVERRDEKAKRPHDGENGRTALKPDATESTHTSSAPKLGNRQRKHWSAGERQRAAQLLDNGASYAETGRILGRTSAAVQKARSAGILPCKTHTINPKMQYGGAISAILQGRTVNPQKQQAILNRLKQ